MTDDLERTDAPWPAAGSHDETTRSAATESVPRQTQVIDFFCGCGGTSAGLRAAGLRIAAGIDFDADAAATFRHNFPEARFFEQDVRELAQDALDGVVASDGHPLLLAACAPCQPYSSLRRDSARSPDRTLLLRLMPFVERLRPDVVLVENVPGMQKVPARSTWNRFIARLRKLDYHVSWRVVDCRAYGVPQRRRRLILLASLGVALEIPSATHGPGIRPFTTVGDWIVGLPPLEAGQADPIDLNHRAGGLGPLNLDRICALSEGGSRADWPDHLWLDCHRNHTGHQDYYGRLHRERCAPVLTTKCTDITSGRFGHPVENRAISVREAACLQTFERTFEFLGTLKSTTRQVGNAVPVLLARCLGEHISAHLSDRSVLEPV